VRARGPRGAGRRQVPAELELESEFGSGKKTALTGGVHLSAREGGRGEEAGRAGGLGRRSRLCGGGRKKEVGWAYAGEEKEKKEGQLGRAGGEEGEEKGQDGLGRKEEKIEKKEKEIVGRAQ
jgi:hypothetical protein